MLIPNDGFLPQTSHTAAMTRRLPSKSCGNGDKVSILHMGALETLSASDLRRSISAYRDALRAHQEVINRLNVYPVPDGDTGTNMALTLDAVATELEGIGADAEMAEVCKAIAHGSLMGARGNSGVILSQLLRGIADRFSPTTEAGPVDLSEAL